MARRVASLILLLALLAAPVSALAAVAADSTTTAKAPAPSRPAAPRPAATAGARPATPRSAPATRRASAGRPAATGTAAARTGIGPRRLEDIHIEGEIPAPQVLFITARDQRRFMGSRHRQYLRTARELGEATPLPCSLIVVRPEPVAPPR